MAGGVRDDLERNYAAAKQLVADIEAVWIAQNRPLLTEGGATGSAIVPHPLVKMLQEARRDVDRFAKQLKQTHNGPKVKAVATAHIGESPRTPRKLKAAS